MTVYHLFMISRNLSLKGRVLMITFMHVSEACLWEISNFHFASVKETHDENLLERRK